VVGVFAISRVLLAMVVDEFRKIFPNTWMGRACMGGGDELFSSNIQKSIVDYSDRLAQVFPSVVDYSGVRSKLS